MEHPPKYPVATLEQMAEIPEEALPRFLAELPTLLDHVRALKELSAMLDGALVMHRGGDPVWIDDLQGTATIAVEVPQGQDFQIVTKIAPAKP